MPHFFSVTFPLQFLITLKYFFGTKMQLCGKYTVWFYCKLGDLEEEMVKTNAARSQAPSSIPIKLDELKLK